jgi:hypothetical protein
MVVTRRTSQLGRRVTRSTSCSFASRFGFGVDHGRRHVSLVRVGGGGRRQENQVIGLSVGVSGTTVAVTQGTQGPRRPPVRIHALQCRRSCVVNDKEPSMVVDVAKTKTPGPHSSNSIAPPALPPSCGSTHVSPPDSSSINSGPFTPIKSRLLNSTPDSDKTLPLPTPVQQSLDRCILNQRKLCPRRRWDVRSGKWIRPAMPFFDEDHRDNLTN